MDFPLQAAGFEGQNLTVRSSVWAGPKLLQNGTLLKREKGKYSVKNNAGRIVTIQLRIDFLDMAVPKVLVDNQLVPIVLPLTAAQKIWAALPIILILGGAIGGGLGASAVYINTRIYRAYSAPAAQYGLTALVSVSAVILYLILSAIVWMFINGDGTEVNTTY